MRFLTVGVVATLLGLLCPPTSAGAAVVPPPLVLTVLGPDGRPAENAVAVAQVFDRISDEQVAHRKVYEFRAARGGVVTVRLPLSDPYIAARYPETRVFNVHVNLFAFAGQDRSRPTAFHAVNYVLNLGDPAYPRDLAAVEGAVVDLVPLPAPAGLRPPTLIPPEDTCDRYPPGAPTPPVWACTVVSHPAYAANEHVVIAHNIGASVDMVTSLEVQNTLKLSTSTVSGVSGVFVEARGSTTLSNEDRIGFGYRSDGISSPNEDAVVLTDFAQVDHYVCWGRDCTRETTFVPDGVRGALDVLEPTSAPIYHGYATSSATDCIVPVRDYFWNSTGVNRDEAWTFGFDFEGSVKVFTLHANAVVEREVANSTTNYYKWRVTGTSKKHHYIFVPYGRADPRSAATCPDNAPGDTWTDSSDRPKFGPAPAVPVALPPPVQEVVAPVRDHLDRCRAAPERCGRDF
jgi:hypothetical protein